MMYAENNEQMEIPKNDTKLHTSLGNTFKSENELFKKDFHRNFIASKDLDFVTLLEHLKNESERKTKYSKDQFLDKTSESKMKNNILIKEVEYGIMPSKETNGYESVVNNKDLPEVSDTEYILIGNEHLPLNILDRSDCDPKLEDNPLKNTEKNTQKREKECVKSISDITGTISKGNNIFEGSERDLLFELKYEKSDLNTNEEKNNLKKNDFEVKSMEFISEKLQKEDNVEMNITEQRIIPVLESNDEMFNTNAMLLTKSEYKEIEEDLDLSLSSSSIKDRIIKRSDSQLDYSTSISFDQESISETSEIHDVGRFIKLGFNSNESGSQDNLSILSEKEIISIKDLELTDFRSEVLDNKDFIQSVDIDPRITEVNENHDRNLLDYREESLSQRDEDEVLNSFSNFSSPKTKITLVEKDLFDTLSCPLKSSSSAEKNASKKDEIIKWNINQKQESKQNSSDFKPNEALSISGDNLLRKRNENINCISYTTNTVDNFRKECLTDLNSNDSEIKEKIKEIDIQEISKKQQIISNFQMDYSYDSCNSKESSTNEDIKIHNLLYTSKVVDNSSTEYAADFNSNDSKEEKMKKELLVEEIILKQVMIPALQGTSRYGSKNSEEISTKKSEDKEETSYSTNVVDQLWKEYPTDLKSNDLKEEDIKNEINIEEIIVREKMIRDFQRNFNYGSCNSKDSSTNVNIDYTLYNSDIVDNSRKKRITDSNIKDSKEEEINGEIKAKEIIIKENMIEVSPGNSNNDNDKLEKRLTDKSKNINYISYTSNVVDNSSKEFETFSIINDSKEKEAKKEFEVEEIILKQIIVPSFQGASRYGSGNTEEISTKKREDIEETLYTTNAVDPLWKEYPTDLKSNALKEEEIKNEINIEEIIVRQKMIRDFQRSINYRSCNSDESSTSSNKNVDCSPYLSNVVDSSRKESITNLNSSNLREKEIKKKIDFEEVIIKQNVIPTFQVNSSYDSANTEESSINKNIDCNSDGKDFVDNFTKESTSTLKYNNSTKYEFKKENYTQEITKNENLKSGIIKSSSQYGDVRMDSQTHENVDMVTNFRETKSGWDLSNIAKNDKSFDEETLDFPLNYSKQISFDKEIISEHGYRQNLDEHQLSKRNADELNYSEDKLFSPSTKEEVKEASLDSKWNHLKPIHIEKTNNSEESIKKNESKSAFNQDKNIDWNLSEQRSKFNLSPLQIGDNKLDEVFGKIKSNNLELSAFDENKNYIHESRIDSVSCSGEHFSIQDNINNLELNEEKSLQKVFVPNDKAYLTSFYDKPVSVKNDCSSRKENIKSVLPRKDNFEYGYKESHSQLYTPITENNIIKENYIEPLLIDSKSHWLTNDNDEKRIKERISSTKINTFKSDSIVEKISSDFRTDGRKMYPNFKESEGDIYISELNSISNENNFKPILINEKKICIQNSNGIDIENLKIQYKPSTSFRDAKTTETKSPYEREKDAVNIDRKRKSVLNSEDINNQIISNENKNIGECPLDGKLDFPKPKLEFNTNFTDTENKSLIKTEKLSPVNSRKNLHTFKPNSFINDHRIENEINLEQKYASNKNSIIPSIRNQSKSTSENKRMSSNYSKLESTPFNTKSIKKEPDSKLYEIENIEEIIEPQRYMPNLEKNHFLKTDDKKNKKLSPKNYTLSSSSDHSFEPSYNRSFNRPFLRDYSSEHNSIIKKNNPEIFDEFNKPFVSLKFDESILSNPRYNNETSSSIWVHKGKFPSQSFNSLNYHPIYRSENPYFKGKHDFDYGSKGLSSCNHYNHQNSQRNQLWEIESNEGYFDGIRSKDRSNLFKKSYMPESKVMNFPLCQNCFKHHTLLEDDAETDKKEYYREVSSISNSHIGDNSDYHSNKIIKRDQKEPYFSNYQKYSFNMESKSKYNTREPPAKYLSIKPQEPFEEIDYLSDNDYDRNFDDKCVLSSSLGIRVYCRGKLIHDP